MLPEVVKDPSDWLNSVHFGPKFSPVSPSQPSLEKLLEGRLVAVWTSGLISVGCSGMRWGRVMVFQGQALELVLAGDSTC